ncbi:radical SAM family heme chaperone HemW [Erythrobacter sp. LQ02-29]|uniref:radical SAM family heme chaperone HemW n=1 Tax=Erythrobacter sp. LQ02-29 TaxID=2920384 RepID=UPI001F4EE294|nr:radical SAM family heme chaperone HemW [Erythrobacter sp. LQ02-29]
MARALYIHWPFCLKKCPYCDFNSHVREDVDQAPWLTAMKADMQAEAALAGNETLTSIFFGGGTPSLMEARTVAGLLEEAERLWGFAPDIEITCEANPTSFEAARFRDFAAAGVNRVSLGVQSFEPEALRFLGREHSVGEATAALEAAQSIFDRVTFDLIYARPNQSPEEWERELRHGLSFATRHLSLYQLTIEPGTRFATDVRRGDFAPLDDDAAADLFAVTRELTESAGLPAYEISNHATSGKESAHNLTYWRYRDYVGIGPGAHGRRSGLATTRHRKPENWLAAIDAEGSGIAETRELSVREQASEALLMGLRLREGIDRVELGRRFGLEPDRLLRTDRLALYTDLGFVRTEGARIAISPAGMPLLDALLGELVDDGLVTS